jgi:excisionase family DNA binding protein
MIGLSNLDTLAVTTPRALRVEEAAKLLGIGRSLAYRLVREKRLRSVKAGHRRLVPVAAVDEFLTAPGGDA